MSIELRGVDETRRRLENVPPSMRRNLTRRIGGIAGEVTSDQKSTAGAYSTRIPRSITVQTKFIGRTVGVRIRSSKRIAPHNRINEFGGYHPTYGSWEGKRKVYQPARPFFFPPVRRKATRIRGEVQAAITDTIREF